MGRRVPRLAPIFVTLRAIGCRADWTCYTRTKHGWHVAFNCVPHITGTETIALQAILDSDRKRETLNLMRAINVRKYGASKFWRKRTNILYEGKLT